MDSLSWCHRGRRRKRGSSQLQYRNATSPDLAPSHQLSSLRTPTTHTWPPPPPPGKGHLFLPAPPSTRRYLRPAALRGLLRATPPTPGGARPGPTVAARRVRPFPFPLAPTYRRWGAPVGGGAQDSLRGPARTFSALPGGAACCASPRYAAAPCPPTPPALTLARPGRAGRPEGWPLLDLRRRHGLRKNTDRHRRKFKGRPPRVLDLLTDGAAFRGMAPCSSSQPASCQRATFDHLDWSSWNPGPKDEAGSGRLWQATGGRSPPPTTALLTWVGQRGNVRGGGNTWCSPQKIVTHPFGTCRTCGFGLQVGAKAQTDTWSSGSALRPSNTHGQSVKLGLGGPATEMLGCNTVMAVVCGAGRGGWLCLVPGPGRGGPSTARADLLLLLLLLFLFKALMAAYGMPNPQPWLDTQPQDSNRHLRLK